jgi:hypothetical protein
LVIFWRIEGTAVLVIFWHVEGAAVLIIYWHIEGAAVFVIFWHIEGGAILVILLKVSVQFEKSFPPMRSKHGVRRKLSKLLSNRNQGLIEQI